MKFKLIGSHCFLALLFNVGCQSYEPAPLNIESYRNSLETRLIDVEPVTAFANRIAQHEGRISVFSVEDGISPAEGEVIALFYNPKLRIARLEAGVALATYETAGLWEDPVFGFDGADISSPSAPFEFGLMANFTIPISGRLQVEKELAGSAYETKRREVINAEWNTRALVRETWAEWASATIQVELIQEVIEQLERINGIADILEAAEEINRVERRLLYVELIENQVKSTEAELQLLQTELRLIEALGLPPEGASFLITEFPIIESKVFVDETQRLIDANTELAIRFSEYQTAEDSLRLEIKKQYPDIVFGSGYGSEFNDHRVLFGLSIPLSIWNRNQAGIARARTNREVARAKAETTFARIDRELALANATLRLKQQQRAYFDGKIIPLLEEQSKDIENIMNLGEVDTFVLLETVTRQYEAKQQLVELQVAQLRAQVTRHRILGPDYQLESSPFHQEMTSDDTLGGVQ